MPLTPALIVGIISAAVGAAGVGESIAQSQQGGPPKPPPPTPQPQAPATNAAQISAVQQSIPNYIANTSGFASPGYVEQMAGANTGLSNNPQASGNLQAAISQYFGLTAPGQTGFTGQTANPITSSSLNLPGGTGAGGSPLTGGGGSSFVDNLLNQQDFKAFS